LIEGVNTAAENVVVFDGTLDQRNLDHFTFSNIRGRAGRMFRHFVGKVYVFHREPEIQLTTVDIPIASQSSRAPLATLLQLPANELSPEAAERLAPIYEQDVLPLDVLRLNKGISPERQIELAEELSSKLNYYHQYLSWIGFPKYHEMIVASDLILKYLVDPRQRRGISAKALAARLYVVSRSSGSLRPIIESQLRYSESRNEAVEEVLYFLRNWMGNTVPRGLLALERIQSEVFRGSGLSAGNYKFYAGQVERQFLPDAYAALEEYGLPVQTSLRLRKFGLRGPDIDSMLLQLRRVAANPQLDQYLDPFELEMVEEVIAGLGPQALTAGN
jgi:hypothetical protein